MENKLEVHTPEKVEDDYKIHARILPSLGGG